MILTESELQNIERADNAARERERSKGREVTKLLELEVKHDEQMVKKWKET